MRDFRPQHWFFTGGDWGIFEKFVIIFQYWKIITKPKTQPPVGGTPLVSYIIAQTPPHPASLASKTLGEYANNRHLRLLVYGVDAEDVANL